jgi:hypothetical protein
MKYKYNKKKIEFLFNKTLRTKIAINNLGGLQVKKSSITYLNNSAIINTEWMEPLANTFTYGTLVLDLIRFPADLIPYIRFIPIAKTLDAWIDSQGIDYISSFKSYPTIARTNSQEVKVFQSGANNILNDYQISYYLEANLAVEMPVYLKVIVVIPNVRHNYEIQTKKR